MMSLRKHLINALVGTALAAVPATALTSCDLIYKDLEPCPQGVELRFIYDYNMEFANAFPAQVHCLTLLVYDAAGNYITTHTVTDRDLLGDEDWRMQLRLDPGEYRFIAYGGMACENASFEFTSSSRAIPALLSDLEVALKPGRLAGQDGAPLHNLFYGMGSITVDDGDTNYRKATIRMKKDTNNLRIILANADGSSLYASEFAVTLEDDNTLLGWDNEVIPTQSVTFTPWATGESIGGITIDGTPVYMPYAEISTSRLVKDAPAALNIVRTSDGRSIFTRPLPLIRVLLQLRSQQFAEMEEQEFLDRNSEWNLLFFIGEDGTWLDATIVINDWEVRINDIDNFGDLD